MQWGGILGINYNTVLFDLDGTLLDTSEGIINSIIYTEKHVPLPAISQEQRNRFIGPPLLASFMRAYHLEEKDALYAVEIYRERYQQKGAMEACVYNGLFELLNDLRLSGRKLAVATLKLEEYAGKVLKHFGLESYFDCVVGSDLMGKKTKADIVRRCLEQMDCHDLSSAVLIGDSQYDMDGALESGIQFIGVTYGFGFSSADAKLLHLKGIPFADNCRQLHELLF